MTQYVFCENYSDKQKNPPLRQGRIFRRGDRKWLFDVQNLDSALIHSQSPNQKVEAAGVEPLYIYRSLTRLNTVCWIFWSKYSGRKKERKYAILQMDLIYMQI